MIPKQTYRILALLALMLTEVAVIAHADDYNNYLDKSDVPNPLTYLPPPPDSSQVIINGDFARWIWGKSLRNTPRGEQASWESLFGIRRMVTIYNDVLGIDITEEGTPALYRLMCRAGSTGGSSVSLMKHYYFRKRPFLLMNETVWGKFDEVEDLRNNSSYPSSHTSYGWGTALALAEMAPHLQDTILRRGLEYGISRVIVGAHWQSDIDAAIVSSSAAMARAHASEDYVADIKAAREEYAQLKGLSINEVTQSDYPLVGRILDSPYLIDSYAYYGDISIYWQAKTERESERGSQAIDDANLSDDAILESFAHCADIAISNSETPCIAAIMKAVKNMLSMNASTMKNCWYRKRPYVELGDATLIPNEESGYCNQSSYPSRHSLIGWGLALTLAEVMPDSQNTIFKRGYDYGWSRVIAGYSYPSDVQAGRIMAACLLANYHNEQSFNDLLQAAKLEYAQKKAEQGIDNIISLSSDTPGYWYSTQGIIYTSRPTVPGIYIHNGEKVVIGF